MELRHLRYFIAAAEAENLSRAALKLHLSQPALSRQIRDLENELGFALFERSARSVRLTEAGRVFVTEARAVLQRAEEAVQAARALASGGGGELQVGYAASPTARIIPAALRAFHAELPKVRVKLHDLSTQEMAAGIRDGKLQLAVMVRPNRRMLYGLHFEELFHDDMRLAVARTHPLGRLRSVELRRAAKERLLVFTRRDYPEYFEYLDELFASSGGRPRIAEEHDSAASLVAAIESGCGVAIVPQSFSCSAGSRLKLVPLLPAPQPLVIGALWPKAGLAPWADVFLKAAKQAVAAAGL